MKYFFSVILFSAQWAFAQKIIAPNFGKKTDKIILNNLQAHIQYLADDKLEGRRTGTAGEKLAYEYITKEFAKIALIADGDSGKFVQSFEINEGQQIDTATQLIINNNILKINDDFFPLSFSANAALKSTPAKPLSEKSTIEFLDIKGLLEENKNNPHFDLNDALKTKVNEMADDKGTRALIIYNTSSTADELKFEPKATTPKAKIAIVYITKDVQKKYLSNITTPLNIQIKIAITDKKRIGHNIVGFINNHAANTIVLGAHYDHLGYGEDKNSLYTGNTPQIHNGADDNASGTAALIELSKLLTHSKFKNNNYLFVAFSGEELGLYGSKYFTNHLPQNLGAINYMINMDMVGRLNDSTHGLIVGGYGTSPLWSKLIYEKNNFFKIKLDSSGVGPSDHTSFYRKDIPVLFFFTGVHSDYHKPTDDANKINYAGELQVIKYIYNIIEATNKEGKLIFTKTKETATTGRSSFKVTLGIMPDYTFSESGVRVDGVSEGKIAQKVGIKVGDIIVQLGDNKVTDVQTYMQALNKFNKGEATKVKIKRSSEELVLDIIF